MCSNFQPIKRSSNPWVKQHFGIDLPDADWKGHVYPMQKAPFIFLDNGVIRCELGKFGMEPHWAKTKKNYGTRTYNARCETVDSLATYRNAWKERRFGLVLAEKFFEPYYKNADSKSEWAAIERADGKPTAIGSIWERYTDHDTGEVIYSYSMITLNADKHAFMRQFHKPGDEKRSVVIVDDSNLNDWLTANQTQAMELIKLSPDNYLEVSQ